MSRLQTQDYLWECLQRVFPLHSIEVNSRNVRSNTTASGWLELDLGIPDLELGFEFQDAYHYISSWYSQHRLSYVQEKDKTKQELLRRKAKTLITIPCWWDGSVECLRSTILFERPDLAIHGTSSADPITLNPTFNFFNSIGVPGVGELMLASFPRPTYEVFRATITEAEPWWMGEKYDGVRCCWVPKRRTIYTRRGVVIRTPRRYLRWFPNQYIDGEFWFGRSSNDLFRIMRLEGPDWQYCRIVAFDTPVPRPLHAPFEVRYASVLSRVKRRHPFIVIAMRILLTSPAQLSIFTKQIFMDGGEGTILRKVQSLYENGRNNNLVKIKAHGRDLEAIVVDVTDKNWLKLKLPTGVVFKLPPTSIDLRTYPKKGDIVMLTYERITSNGTPVESKVVRIRTDLAWEEVLINHSLENPKQRALPGFMTYAAPASKRKYWEQDQHRVREFFEEFARRRALNPLDPETWYPISTGDIKREKGGHHMLIKLGWGLVGILKRVFPEIKFIDELFQIRTKWPTIEKRREYFISLARDHGFDPLIPDNWYKFSPNVLDYEGYSRVLRVYRFNMRVAMMDVFPDVKFELGKFASTKKGYWMQHENRRKYFTEFANAMGFDPLIPQNWYKYDSTAFDQKSKSIIRLYNNSMAETIIATFPELGLDLDKFETKPMGYWQSVENRRRFFVELANKHGFDPLVPENWVHVRKGHILAMNGGYAMLSVTNGSLLASLQTAFPQIRFTPHYVYKLESKFWHNRENRKQVFIEYAQQNGLDAEDYSTWYNANPRDIRKGAKGMLLYYKGSLRTAISDLFPGIDKSFLFTANKGPPRHR